MTKYNSKLTREQIQERRIWQKEVYEKISTNKSREPMLVDVLGKDICVHPGVFPPTFADSIVLAQAVRNEVKGGDSVLDMGCGSGVQTVFATEYNHGASVYAVDRYEAPLKSTRQNLKNRGLEGKVTILKSDLFSKIPQGTKFDVIIYNPPFRWFKPKDNIEQCSLDENYKNLRRFFSETKDYLSERGRMLIVFSDSGDIEYFWDLKNKAGFKAEILPYKALDHGWLYETYKLTPRG